MDIKNLSDRLLLSQIANQIGKQKSAEFKDYSPEAKASAEQYLKDLLAEKESRKLN